jgi:hypothetical protein
MVDNLKSLRDILERLCTILNDENAKGPSRLISALELLDGEDGLLAQSRAELMALEKMLESKSKWERALTWPLKEDDVTKSLERLDSLKTTLIVALMADQTCVPTLFTQIKLLSLYKGL